MNNPRCKVVAASQRYRKIAMRSLSFDGSDLIIEVQGEAFVWFRIVFRFVEGFRVLDEGNLGEFWKDYHSGNGWFYAVECGGWLELESHRNSLLTVIPHKELREYFLVDNKCLSVLTRNPPEFFLLGGDPDRA